VTVTSLMTALTDSVSVTFVQKSIPLGATPTVRMTYLDTGIAGSVGKVDGAAAAIVANALNSNQLAESVTAGTALWMATSSTSSYASAKFMIAMDSRTATHGVYTYTVVATPFTAGTAAAAITADVTITVSDPYAGSATATGAAGTSTAIMDSGEGLAFGSVDDEVTGSFAPGTVVGVIRITQLTSAGANEPVTSSSTEPKTKPSPESMIAVEVPAAPIALATAAKGSLTVIVKSAVTATPAVLAVNGVTTIV